MANRERVVVALVLLFAGLALSGCAVQAPPELFTAITEGDLDYIKTTLENNPKFANSKTTRKIFSSVNFSKLIFRRRNIFTFEIF